MGLSASSIMTLLVVDEELYRKMWRPERDMSRPMLNAGSVSLYSSAAWLRPRELTE